VNARPVVLRITVEDVLTGERETAEVQEGDYLLLCAAPCYVAHTQAFPKSGTHQLTVKDYGKRMADVPTSTFIR
jgi:hypothetical protein